MRRAIAALALLCIGCKPVEVPPGLAGATIERAWLEDYEWVALGVVGGGLDGRAWLYAEGSDGVLYEQYVEIRGGLAGFAVEVTFASEEHLELDLPPAPITGDDLFSRYRGSFEAFVVGFGFASLHLKNEHGVEIDDDGLAFFMGISVSAAWMQLVPAEPPPEPDTAETGDSAPLDETGDSGPADETGDSAQGGTGLADG